MGPMQDISAEARLCPVVLWGSQPIPSMLQTRGQGKRLVIERCEEQAGRRKSSNTKQVSGEPKLCCFLLIMKYS